MFRQPVVLGVVLVSAGCAQDDLAIAGTYLSAFQETVEIDDDTWTTTYAGTTNSYDIVVFDNDARFVVAQNDADNAYNPDLWSRFDWAFDGDDLFICQTVFDGASQAEAEDATPADATDPATSGCGNYAFTPLTLAQQ